MAYSKVAYTGNGATTDYTVPFPYLDRSHVSVSVNDVTASFSWVTDTIVRLAVAAPNSSTVLITRNSNRATRLGDFQDGQALTESMLDYDSNQIFFVAQEAFDAVADAAAGGDMRRSYNLSDVYDLNAARANLGAIGRTGDTMLGPLYLNGPFGSPSQAITKGYVDSVFASFGSGVQSFNGRGGNVLLASGDVTNALGFLPMSLAGGQLTGPLLLADDPTNPLGAVTKQYVDANITHGASTGEYTFPNANFANAAMLLSKSTQASTDRSGAANLVTTRIGGQGMTSFFNQYNVTNSHTAGVDIAMTNIIRTEIPNIVNNSIGTWSIAAGPRLQNALNWATVGLVSTALERVADQGLKRVRTGGKTTMGVMVVPEKGINLGDGAQIGFNTSFGIGVVASEDIGSGRQKTWVPLYFEQDCTAPGGIQILARGGSSLALAPSKLMDATDYFSQGIDLSGATFDPAGDNTAIRLAKGQAIHVGPVERIYVDPTNNLTFYDSVAGVPVTLASLLGGAGGTLAANNSWTGKNLFSKIDGPSPAYTLRVQSIGTGAIANGGIILDTGYSAAADIRKSSDQSVEGVAGGGNAALYVQHVVSGANAVNNVNCGIRVQLQTTQSRGAGSVNDAVAGYFGLNNTGNNVGGFGVHVDAYHSAGGSSTTFGTSVEMYRTTSAGANVGNMVRVIGSAGYTDSDYGFLLAAGGDASRGVIRGLSMGGPLVGQLFATYGIDLTWCNTSIAAIAMQSGSKLAFSTDYQSATMSFDSGTGLLNMLSGGGLPRMGVSMTGGFPGTLYQYANQGGYGDYFLDTAGNQSAVISFRSGSRTASPNNPSTINNWMVVRMDGVNYRLPLYL